MVSDIAVRLSCEQRDDLLAAEPTTYYLTDHYVDYPCVLVRLASIRRDALRDLLEMGWRFMSGGKATGRSSGARGRPRRRPQRCP